METFKPDANLLDPRLSFAKLDKVGGSYYSSFCRLGMLPAHHKHGLKLMKKYTWMPIAMTLGLLVQPYCCAAEFTDPIVIEAEDFASQHLDDKRRWFIVSEGHTEHPYADNDVAHLEGASGGKYLEILPDTRTNHSEDLLPGENFTDTPGEVAVLSYPVFFEKAGRYYVWARAFSTGSEDNGMHIGLDGDWPETSQRLQLCEGKNQWTWSSARRTAKKHCGEPNTIWIDIQTHGLHLLTVSMREDGFELDKLLLTQDPTYVPQGEGPKSSASPKVELKKKSSFIGISEYKNLLTATKDFTFSEQDKKRPANAGLLTL